METTREVNVADSMEIRVDTPDETEEEDEEILPPVEEEPQAPEPAQPSASSPDEVKEPQAPSQAQVPSQQPLTDNYEAIADARLKEIVRLRKEVREEKTKKIFEDVKGGPVTSERFTKLKERYSEDEIQSMEEAVDVIAESKGYVKKEQTYKDNANAILEAFFEENPEYKPSNDKEDVRWGRFKELLTSGVYNLSDKTPKQLRYIYSQVHQSVVQELGDTQAHRDERKIAAQQQKIKSVSHSGGTKPASTAKPVVDATIRSHFKGFDDEDLV